MNKCSRCGRPLPLPDESMVKKGDTLCAECGIDERAFEEYLRGNTPRLYVVPALLVINIGIFVAMGFLGVSTMSPEPKDLVLWGANFGLLIEQGQWWRLLTAIFLHSSPLHLLFNMLCLWVLGGLAERMYGNLPFLMIYLVGGLGGSLLSVSVHPQTISVGASGAIFGFVAAMVVFLLGETTPGSPAFLRNKAGALLAFVSASLVIGFLEEGVDNAGHIGGLVAGGATGYLFIMLDTAVKGRLASKVLSLAGLVLFTGAGLSVVYKGPLLEHLREAGRDKDGLSWDKILTSPYRRSVEEHFEKPPPRTPEQMKSRSATGANSVLRKTMSYYKKEITGDRHPLLGPVHIMGEASILQFNKMSLRALDVARPDGTIVSLSRRNKLLTDLYPEYTLTAEEQQKPFQTGSRHGICILRPVLNQKECHGCHEPEKTLLGFFHACVNSSP